VAVAINAGLEAAIINASIKLSTTAIAALIYARTTSS